MCIQVRKQGDESVPQEKDCPNSSIESPAGDYAFLLKRLSGLICVVYRCIAARKA